jgi:hypothetical protein
MNKLINSLTLFGFGLLSLFGMSSNSDASFNQSIQSVKENTPLYLDKAVNLQQLNKQSIILADHQSHQSHYSHESHRSHYSSRY